MLSGTQAGKQEHCDMAHFRSLSCLCFWEPHNPPKCSPGISSFNQLHVSFCFSSKKRPENSPAASSKAEKYNMQNFTKFQSFGTAGNRGNLSGWIVWSTAYRYVTIYQLFFRASCFMQVIRKCMPRPTVAGFLLKHFTGQQLWSKPVGFYPSPISFCSDALTHIIQLEFDIY